MPSVHWRSAALAGIAAGVVATVAQIALWWASSEPLPAILFRDARLTAAIIMGRQVLPPPATFDGSIMLVAALVHVALSIAYGLTLSVFISRLSTPLSLLAGAAFGLLLYVINMHGFTFFFPWFAAARDWITAATHVVFGMVVAAVYKTRRVRTSRSTKPS
ncbi:MAG TPA: sodium:proline symporter [Casimicrobiaceae bacterium]